MKNITYKVVIAGNHDLYLENKSLDEIQKLLSNAIYLQDSECNIKGLRIYGTPWIPKFGKWAFMLSSKHKLNQKWEKIPSGIDILITHGPHCKCLIVCL